MTIGRKLLSLSVLLIVIVFAPSVLAGSFSVDVDKRSNNGLRIIGASAQLDEHEISVRTRVSRSLMTRVNTSSEIEVQLIDATDQVLSRQRISVGPLLLPRSNARDAYLSFKIPQPSHGAARVALNWVTAQPIY